LAVAEREATTTPFCSHMMHMCTHIIYMRVTGERGV